MIGCSLFGKCRVNEIKQNDRQNCTWAIKWKNVYSSELVTYQGPSSICNNDQFSAYRFYLFVLIIISILIVLFGVKMNVSIFWIWKKYIPVCIKQIVSIWLILNYTGAAYTVAFSAVANVGIITYNAGEKVMFEDILYAVGGGYDKTTGVFTVPKNGLYIIFCNILNSLNGDFWATIIINGLKKAGVMVYSGSSAHDFHSGSNLIVQQLQVNDRVWIQTMNRGSLFSANKDTIFTVVMIKSSE